jgi:hypothetical protein
MPSQKGCAKLLYLGIPIELKTIQSASIRVRIPKPNEIESRIEMTDAIVPSFRDNLKNRIWLSGARELRPDSAFLSTSVTSYNF